MKRYLPSQMTIWLSVSLALIFASAALYLAFDHNPQGEFFDPLTGNMQWRNVIELGLIAFFEAYLVVFAIANLLERLWKADIHLLKPGQDDGEA